MVARNLVEARAAHGVEAHLVNSADAWDPAYRTVPVLPVMRGGLSGAIGAAPGRGARGAILGRRPKVTDAYEGLHSVDHGVVVVHNIPEGGVRSARRDSLRVLYLHNDVLRFYSRRELRDSRPMST